MALEELKEKEEADFLGVKSASVYDAHMFLFSHSETIVSHVQSCFCMCFVP